MPIPDIYNTEECLQDVLDVLQRYDTFALSGHVSPDGDCLGTQLALGLALRKLGKSADFLLAEDALPEYGLRLLPHFDEMVPAGQYTKTPQVFIACDVPTTDRLKQSADVQARCEVTVTIDHHLPEQLMSQHNYICPASPSSTMLVWEMAKRLDAVTPEVAQCAYMGLMTDTGRFQYSNVTPEAFIAAAEMFQAGADVSQAATDFFQNKSLASLRLEQRMLERVELLYQGTYSFSYITLADYAETQAEQSDADALIDTLRSLRGVQVACILKERDGFIRGSFRAKDSTDVSAVARTLGGGGHRAAAGFTLHMPLEQAIATVKAAIDGLAAE